VGASSLGPWSTWSSALRWENVTIAHCAMWRAVFFLSERSLQLGPVSGIPSKIYCHALALGVGFSHSEKTLVEGAFGSSI
jgi:hypothetical protein